MSLLEDAVAECGCEDQVSVEQKDAVAPRSDIALCHTLRTQ